MKAKSMIQKIFIIFFIIIFSSCSIPPSDTKITPSAEDLLGEWEFVSTDNGEKDLAYDIEFLGDGTVRVIEDSDSLVDVFEYKITKPGTIKLSALGIEKVANYEITENKLILTIGNGKNIYERDYVIVVTAQPNITPSDPEETPVSYGDYSFQVPNQQIIVTINLDASITVDYQITIQNEPNADEIDIIDIALPNNYYNLGSITAELDGKAVSTIKYSDLVTPGISLFLSDSAISPGEKGDIHINIPSISNSITLAAQAESEEYVSLVFKPNWFGSQLCHGTTSYQLTILLPSGVTESEGRYFIPDGWTGKPEPNAMLMEDGRIFYTWDSDQENSFSEYSFGASFPSRYLTESMFVAEPSDYFLSLPDPVKVLDKPNGRWKIFGNDFYDISAEKDGVLWLKGFTGLTAFDIATGKIKHYTTFDGLPSNEVNSVLVTKSGVLIAGFSEIGIYKYENFKWNSMDSKGLDTVIGETSDGVLWAEDFWIPNLKVGQFSNGSWVVHDSWSGSKAGNGGSKHWVETISEDGDFWAEKEDQNGRPIIVRYHDGSWQVNDQGLPDEFTLLAVRNAECIWIRVDRDIYVYDGDSSRFITSIPTPEYDLEFVSFEPDNTLTLAAFNNDVISVDLYRISETAFEKLDLGNGTPANGFSCVFKDDSGKVWVCTQNGIAEQQPDSSWRTFPFANIEHLSLVQEIDISADETVWFSTRNGLNSFSNKEWKQYGANEGLPEDTEGFAISREGFVWVGTREGSILSYKDSKWTTYDAVDGLDLGTIIWDIEVGPDGRVWAGGDGLAIFDGTEWKKIPETVQDEFSDIRTIEIGLDGSVWVVGYDFENEGKIALYFENNWTEFDKSDGLDAGGIVDSLEFSPTGVIHVGTKNGIFRFINNIWEKVGDERYVNDIAFEGDGSFWVATEFDGILHYVDDNQVEQYTVEDGLPSYRLQAIAIDNKGAIWVGCYGGVVRINPDK